MTDPLLICAPMRIEARAIRQGLRGSATHRAHAHRLRHHPGG